MRKLVAEVKQKRELADIPDNIVEKILREYLDKHKLDIPKGFKERKIIIKEVRNELRRYSGQYSSKKDYKKRGDHSQFLWHSIDEYGLIKKFPDIKEAGEEYMKKVKSLSPEIRVMSIVSRENELPGIFTRVLTAKKWKAEGLPEFRYYLKRHIFLDSHKGGHADMLSDFKIDNRVAIFYKIRLDMYKSIPKLF